MWLKENRENRITCFGGCSSFRGSISLRDFSSCGPNLRAQIGWGRNLVSETRASSPLFGKSSNAPFYSIFTTTGAIGVSETSFPDIEGQLPISPGIAPQEARSAARLGSFGGLAFLTHVNCLRVEARRRLKSTPLTWVWARWRGARCLWCACRRRGCRSAPGCAKR